jgi:Na+-transporting NADH:ubiquinone oxidoreductase subunit NqrC
MKRTAKTTLILVLVLVLLLIAGAGIRYELEKKAQKKRDATYATRLLSFTLVLKPGMTRKDVEDYLRSKNIKFR